MGLFTKKTPHTAGEVDRSRLPRHIAVIMDGNGRWAKKRGLPRTVGHKAGAEVFRDIATYCKELGVEYLTVYAFSTENWKRPADEVNTIMGLLEQYLREAIDTMEKEHIRLRFFGDLSALSPELQALAHETDDISGRYAGFQANVCLNYGGRAEILRAARLCAEQGVDWTEENLSANMYSAGIPDPELDHPPQRRDTAEQFHAVAVCLQRILFLRHAVAGFYPAGYGQSDHRLSAAGSPVRRRKVR